MAEQEAKELAVKSIRSASLRDSFSGDGIDILVIDKNTSKMTTEKIN
jgi:proteasome beta subunit